MIVTIAGAGTMGHGLALVHALGGCEVRLQDISPQALDVARHRMGKALELLQASGAAAASRPEHLLDRSIRYTTDLAEAMASTDLFIECVAEDKNVKVGVFEQADRHAPEATIFTSNTSHLDPFPLIPVRRLARACAVHWYSPPYIIDLVDIAPSPEAPDCVPQFLCEMYRAMGKRPVKLSRFVPGYVVNRIQAAITREVFSILAEGYAGIVEIDESLRHGLALRMALLGHFMRSDFTGLKLLSVLADMRRADDPGGRLEAATLAGLCAKSHTGIEVGRGFYDYEGRSAPELSMDRDRNLLALKEAFAALTPITALPSRDFRTVAS